MVEKKKGKHAHVMLTVQTQLPESVVKYLDKLAAQNYLSRADYIRRWVLDRYKVECDK